MIRTIQAIAIVALLLSSVVTQDAIGLNEFQADSTIVIKKYSTKFMYVSQIPTDSINLTIHNAGSVPVSEVYLLVRDDRQVITYQSDDDIALDVNVGRGSILENWKIPFPYNQVRINLRDPIMSGDTRDVNNLVLYFNSFGEFFPKTVTLFEDQTIRFSVMRFPASPYVIDKLHVSLVFGDTWNTEAFESTRVWEALQPTTDVVKVVLNAHHTESKQTDRYIEISHWGNIYVREQYKLQNRAAKLVGEYSTIDYNANRKDTGKNSFRDATVTLPKNAWGLFYRDEIGNISTGYVKHKVSHSKLGRGCRTSSLS